MFEYPEVLNTKEDYLNMLEYDREETVKRLERLLDDKYIWVESRVLSEGDERIESDDYRYTLCPEGWTTEWKKVLNEHPTAYSLDFTFEEIEALIASNKSV